MATLSLTNDELYAELGRFLGISRDNSKWSTSTQADVNRVIRAGRRRFLSANNWKFLVQDREFTILAPVTTGTVTIVDGTVTLVGATWPSDLVGNYVIAPEGGGVYGIATRTNDTVCILDDTTVDADALSTYVLYRIKYDLPTGFAGWEGPVILENYDGSRINESRNLPEYVLRSFAGMQTARTGRPELFSIVSTSDSETGIATHVLRIYPLPDQLYIASGRYKLSVGDTLDAADSAICADQTFAECYKEACLSAAEVIAFGQPGAHAARYAELLREAIQHDNAMAGVRYGRPRRNSRRRSRYYDLIVGTVDMSGQEP
jgi:hypothetical protein